MWLLLVAIVSPPSPPPLHLRLVPWRFFLALSSVVPASAPAAHPWQYLGYAVLICFGYLRDAAGRLFRLQKYRTRAGYAPLLRDFDDFYTRRLYHRIQDCWGRPIASPAGAWIRVVARRFVRTPAGLTLEVDVPPPPPSAAGDGDAPAPASSAEDAAALARAPTRRVLNMGSYNYLGYAEVPGGVDASVLDALDTYGVSTCAPAAVGGHMDVHEQLEATVAAYVGKPAAIVLGMGFATNAQLLPALVGSGCLLLSDSLNHASIIMGARSSGAAVRVFGHNDAANLEAVLRAAIVDGQPGSGAPWRKILIVVEGMYSMEGETCDLRAIVAIKKRYGAYLFLDEAHSIGALGATGRGVCEHYGVSPADVDVLMGTFTKSFGAVGGYVAASEAVVAHVRAAASGVLYATTMSPPCAAHILWALSQIAGTDGTTVGAAKLAALRANSIYFRARLVAMGVKIYGDYDSPVVPIMLFHPAKIAAFSRECLARGVAVVVVGFPATPLLLSRARICLSAAHTRADLDRALDVIADVATLLQIRFHRPSLLARTARAARVLAGVALGVGASPRRLGARAA